MSLTVSEVGQLRAAIKWAREQGWQRQHFDPITGQRDPNVRYAWEDDRYTSIQIDRWGQMDIAGCAVVDLTADNTDRVRIALDTLVAWRVLPPSMSSAYWAGEAELGIEWTARTPSAQHPYEAYPEETARRYVAMAPHLRLFSRRVGPWQEVAS